MIGGLSLIFVTLITGCLGLLWLHKRCTSLRQEKDDLYASIQQLPQGNTATTSSVTSHGEVTNMEMETNNAYASVSGKISMEDNYSYIIVANCPYLGGTVPIFGALSRFFFTQINACPYF